MSLAFCLVSHWQRWGPGEVSLSNEVPTLFGDLFAKFPVDLWLLCILVSRRWGSEGSPLPALWGAGEDLTAESGRQTLWGFLWVSSNSSSWPRHSTGIRGHHPAWRQASLRVCWGNCAQSHSHHQEGEKLTLEAVSPLTPGSMIVVGGLAKSFSKGRRSIPHSPLKGSSKGSIFSPGKTPCWDVHGHLWELKTAAGKSCEDSEC